MRTKSLALMTAVAIVAAGCVIRTHHTIEAHVTVDIRQVDEQAEQIVDYVTGEQDTLPETAGKAEPEKTSWLRRAWDSVAPMQVAHAQALKESSPKVKSLADKMRQRYPEIQALKSQGSVGETNRGYLELRPSEAMNDAQAKNAAQRLIAAENSDRKALYLEIVELNRDQNVPLSVVEQVFAEKWRNQAKSGEQVQLPPSGEAFDKFKASSLGKRLGDKAQPGAWVEVP